MLRYSCSATLPCPSPCCMMPCPAKQAPCPRLASGWRGRRAAPQAQRWRPAWPPPCGERESLLEGCSRAVASTALEGSAGGCGCPSSPRGTTPHHQQHLIDALTRSGCPHPSLLPRSQGRRIPGAAACGGRGTPVRRRAHTPPAGFGRQVADARRGAFAGHAVPAQLPCGGWGPARRRCGASAAALCLAAQRCMPGRFPTPAIVCVQKRAASVQQLAAWPSTHRLLPAPSPAAGGRHAGGRPGHLVAHVLSPEQAV